MKRLCQGCRRAFDEADLAPAAAGDGLFCEACRTDLERPRPSRPAPSNAPALDRSAWIDLSIGGATALLLAVVPFCGCVGQTMVTLFHEFGHAVAGWSFGYPSLPAFDLTHGGGVMVWVERSPFFAVAAYLAIAALAGWLWTARRPRIAIAIGAGAAVHLPIGLTRWHETAIAFMGHGMELVLAGVFLYRGLTGRSVVHRAERPLYAGLGLYVVFHDVLFSIRLLGDRAFQRQYLAGKGGLSHDFHVMSDHLGLGLEPLAATFLALCLVPVGVSAAISWWGSKRDGEGTVSWMR